MSELLLTAGKNRPATVSLDLEDYTIKARHADGTFGIIYKAIDNASGETVAIKAFDPSLEGLAIMLREGLSLEDIARRDHRKRAAAAHLVPTEMEIDRNGILCAVMPFYESDLGSSLSHRRLSLEEQLSFGSDIVSGLVEYQRYEERAHKDITLNNIMVDGKKLLLSDPATARGHPYVRSPHTLRNAEAPLSSDSYAFFATMFRLNTGRAPFQERIDSAHKSGGMQEVSSFFESIDGTTEFRRQQFVELLEHEFDLLKAPNYVRKFMRAAANQEFSNAAELKAAYDDVLLRNNQLAWRRSLMRSVGLIAAGVSVAVGGYSLAQYLKPVPRYAKDFESVAFTAAQIDRRPLKDAMYEFVLDVPTDSIYYGQYGELSFNARWESRKNRQMLAAIDVNDSSYVGVVSRALLQSADELGTKLPLEQWKYRYISLHPMEAMNSTTLSAGVQISQSTLVPFFVGAGLSTISSLNENNLKVNLNDALAAVFLDPKTFMKAVYRSNGTGFGSYSNSQRWDIVDNFLRTDKNRPDLFLHPDYERLIWRTVHRLSQELPQGKYSVRDFPPK